MPEHVMYGYETSWMYIITSWMHILSRALKGKNVNLRGWMCLCGIPICCLYLIFFDCLLGFTFKTDPYLHLHLLKFCSNLKRLTCVDAIWLQTQKSN